MRVYRNRPIVIYAARRVIRGDYGFARIIVDAAARQGFTVAEYRALQGARIEAHKRYGADFGPIVGAR